MRFIRVFSSRLAASALIVALIIYACGISAFVATRADSGSGWRVDVYTQQEPFSGAGQDQPSDAFAPDSVVMLFANVTYNDFPVQNIPVTFQVTGPLNDFYNITFVIAAVGNEFGVAQRQFTIPSLGNETETAVFGIWTVNAYIENAADSLTFRVGWIIQITSAATESLDPPQGGRLGLDISLENIAMTPKNVTLFVSLYDSSTTLINSTSLELIVDPGITNLNLTLRISTTAAVGNGTATVLAYDPDGNLYGPGASAVFIVSLFGDLNFDGRVDLADIGIAASAFGSDPTYGRWNPIADVDKNGRVDIKDIALIAQHFNFGTV